MPAPQVSTEQRALKISIAATTILGLIGVAWGIVSGSQMILLDGMYGIVGTATSWMLLRASAFAAKGPSRNYPFGREAITPLVIGIQGLVLLATLLYAGVEAVFTIRDGGSEVVAGPAILYSALITVACLAVWAWLRREAGHSDLLAAEATAWRVAALRGVGMLIGFTVLWLINGSGWDEAGPYVDPVMVLISCVVLVPAPLAMTRQTVIELLEGAPSDDVRRAIEDAVRAISQQHDVINSEVRATKVGPKMYIEVEGIAPPHLTIAQEHRMRTELERRLDALPYDVWLNFELLPASG